MLDWLASKVAMTIAAVLLLTASAGFFEWQRSDAARRSLAAIAEDLARFLDAVSSLQGDAAFSISFGAGPGHVLPNEVEGIPYGVEIDRGAVIVTRGHHAAFAIIGVPVHLFRPESQNFTAIVLASLDDEHPVIRTSSSGGLEVLRVSITIDGEPSYATFLELPPS